jgi:hypothetical protein
MPPATTVAAFVAFRVEILGCQLPPQALGRAARPAPGAPVVLPWLAELPPGQPSSPEDLPADCAGAAAS